MVKYVYRFRGRNAGAPGAVPGAPETPLAFLDSCFLFSVPIGGFPPHADSILRLVSPSGDSSSGVLHLRCVSQTGRPGPSRERRPLRACARPPRSSVPAALRLALAGPPGALAVPGGPSTIAADPRKPFSTPLRLSSLFPQIRTSRALRPLWAKAPCGLWGPTPGAPRSWIRRAPVGSTGTEVKSVGPPGSPGSAVGRSGRGMRVEHGYAREAPLNLVRSLPPAFHLRFSG